MVSVTSVDSLRNAVAIAERKVQQDQTRVDQDASRLQESRVQLDKDQNQLGRTQQQTRQAEESTALTPAPAALSVERAIATPVPPDLLPRAPQLNAQGQTIGRLINIVA
ncbi:MAG: hypothetical protein V4724_31490 [Pseudomonadota bacterium]